MTIREVQDAILKIKKEKNICILAHAYQSQDIWEVADYIGDSFGLSQKAAQTEADTILMCGVRFMAETVKILSPHKKVILSNSSAGCPTHVRITKRDVENARRLYPDALLLVHPECSPAVVELADFIGSTTEIMEFAEQSTDRSFIIGTGNSSINFNPVWSIRVI